MSILTVSGNTLTFNGKTYRCAIGKNGFAAHKKEGDGCTPMGTFALRQCWYRADRVSAPETQLPLRVITQDDGWCDDPQSAEYNKHIKFSNQGEVQKPSPSGRGLGEGLIERARELRHLSTTPEQKLWAIVRNRQLHGFKFRRQHPFTHYIADFCCEEAKLIIEIDGETHSSTDAVQKDNKRTSDLETLGYKVVRFTNQEIMGNLEGVYKALTLTLSQRERELVPRRENLWREDHQYDLIIPLGYNDDPIIPGLGSAIFLHIAKPDYSGTEGCVALAQEDLLEIMRQCSATTMMRIAS